MGDSRVAGGDPRGLAHSAPVSAYSAWLEREEGINALFRFVIMPLFLFSVERSFPCRSCRRLRGDRVRDAAVERRRSHAAPDARHGVALAVARARRISAPVGVRRPAARIANLRAEADHMSAIAVERAPRARASWWRDSRAPLLFERNLMVYRHTWLTLISGFFEPLFYLFSLGFGLGHFVGERARRVVCELHRAGAARVVGDERRGVRRDDERLLQAPVRQGLRRNAVDAGRRRRTSRSARPRGRSSAGSSMRRAS